MTSAHPHFEHFRDRLASEHRHNTTVRIIVDNYHRRLLRHREALARERVSAARHRLDAVGHLRATGCFETEIEELLA